MTDHMDWLLETLDPELHHTIRKLAAEHSVSVQDISVRLLRLGQGETTPAPMRCQHGIEPHLCALCVTRRKRQQEPHGHPDDTK